METQQRPFIVGVDVAVNNTKVFSVASVLHILSVCVYVTLVTQHAMRMRRIILSSVACPAVLTYSMEQSPS